MAVASIVMEYGGNENQIIAALLHDLPEDRGGITVLHEIEAKFGSRVAEIVKNLSDDMPAPGTPKGEWNSRKKKYLAHLITMDETVVLVSAADKLHNIRSIARDYQYHGEQLWTRFTGGKEGTLWYYSTLAGIYEEKLKDAKLRLLAAEIRNNVKKLLIATNT